MDKIEVRGARTHNLKNINLVIPRDKLIVVTGLSGSGKSSPLAFDTLYAEGQRRYVESLSAYARQFLSLMEKPASIVLRGFLLPSQLSRNRRLITAFYGRTIAKSTTICVCCSPASANRAVRTTVPLAAQKPSARWWMTCCRSRKASV